MLNFFLGQDIRSYLFLLLLLCSTTNTAPYETHTSQISVFPDCPRTTGISARTRQQHFEDKIMPLLWNLKSEHRGEYIKKWRNSPKKFYNFYVFTSQSQRIFIKKNGREKEFSLSQSHTRQWICIVWSSHYWR